jgi:hypothetical protein
MVDGTPPVANGYASGHQERDRAVQSTLTTGLPGDVRRGRRRAPTVRGRASGSARLVRCGLKSGRSRVRELDRSRSGRPRTPSSRAGGVRRLLVLLERVALGQAAWRYPWMSPPSTFTRSIGPVGVDDRCQRDGTLRSIPRAGRAALQCSTYTARTRSRRRRLEDRPLPAQQAPEGPHALLDPPHGGDHLTVPHGLLRMAMPGRTGTD